MKTTLEDVDRNVHAISRRVFHFRDIIRTWRVRALRVAFRVPHTSR